MVPSTTLTVDQLLRHGDRAMILAQRLTEWITHAPDLEQDLALANVGLDLIGQARALYSLAGEREGAGRSEDDFAYQRDAAEYLNPAMVEQPNTDFAVTIVRQFLHDAYAIELWTHLGTGTDPDVAALATKIVPETTYHLRYSRGWLVRLGDGTDESHDRMVAGLVVMAPFIDELFHDDERDAFGSTFDARVAAALSDAHLSMPASVPSVMRSGAPSLYLVAMLDEMQYLRREHPGAVW